MGDKIITCKKCGKIIKDWAGFSFDWCDNCKNYQDVMILYTEKSNNDYFNPINATKLTGE